MHLYIHIPFCDSKCGYCAFYSKVNQEEFIKPYFKALMQDLKYHIEYFNIKEISSIFIGGGTPNFVQSFYYEALFEYLQPLCIKDCEITMESNPNLLNEEWILHTKDLGLNRLSLGVQSFYEDKLALLERKHNQKDILRAFEIAKKHLDNINLDLIYDCKLDTQERLQKELESALQLGINHLSAYSLSIDSYSKFGKNERHDLQKQDSGLGVFVRDFLNPHGFQQYEVSNYALRNKCQHNLGYWKAMEYLGIGVSSVGRIKEIRYYTPLNLESYIQNPLYRKHEYLNQNDLDLEKVFLGLRSEVGVDCALLNQHKLQIALNEGICYQKNQKVYAKDLFLADSLVLFLTD